MLMPRRTKFRKQFRGKRRGMAQNGNTVAFGEFGLQSQSNAWVDARLDAGCGGGARGVGGRRPHRCFGP